jgi:hypothetical protein
MSVATITQTRDLGAFWVALVDDGESRIWVDNRIGPWTVPVDATGAIDQTIDHDRRDVRRREVVPEVATKLRELVRRGGGDARVTYTPAAKATVIPFDSAPQTTTTVQAIAQQMAAAGAAAVRKAA